MNKLNLKNQDKYETTVYFLDLPKAYGILFWIPGVLEYTSVTLQKKEKIFF